MREKRQKTTRVNSPVEFGIWSIENILQELKKELEYPLRQKAEEIDSLRVLCKD